MNYRAMTAAVSELKDIEGEIVIAFETKTDAEDRMQADDPLPTDSEWRTAASEYAFASGQLNRLLARARVLKGRIHFHAETLR